MVNGPKEKEINHFYKSLISSLCFFMINWHKCSSLGYHFRAVARGRKYWLRHDLYLDLSCRFVWWNAPGCSGWLMPQELCRRRGCWSWGNLWLLLDWSILYKCNRGKNCWTIYPWSWLLWVIIGLGSAPRKSLIGVSGCPNSCVKTLAGPLQKRSLLIPVYWLSSYMW